MQINNEYCLRLLSYSTPQVPYYKEDVSNDVVTSILGKVGKHQIFLDVSRCIQLRPSVLSMISHMTSLMYLDISYTLIRDIIPIITDCQSLKSICLAGVQLQDQTQYDSIRYLSNLEYLTLRKSTVTSIDCCKYLSLLRSLNVGETNISSITALGDVLLEHDIGLTRLEELSIDGCTHIDYNSDTANEEVVDVICTMKSLKVLNICDTRLMQLKDIIYIRHSNTDLLIGTKSRRVMFIEAIALNDKPLVLHMLADGADVNERVGVWFDDVMASLWKKKCKDGRFETPCFLVSHEDAELRPLPIHIAIMFGHADIVGIIKRASIGDSDVKVWFSDVSIDDNTGRLVHDHEKWKKINAKKASDLVYTTNALVQGMLDRNVHRLTMGMYASKVANWKTLCEKNMQQISEALHITVAQRNTYSFTKGVKVEHKDTESNDVIVDDGDGNAVIDATVAEDVKVAEDTPIESMDEVVVKEAKKSKRKQMFPILTPAVRDVHWTKHGMVSRLIGEPLVISTSTSGATIDLLGKKSFFLEGKGISLAIKLRKEDDAFTSAYEKHAKSVQAAADASGSKEDKELVSSLYQELVRYKKGIGSYGKTKKYPAAYRNVRSDEADRIAELKERTKQRIDDKYKVRDDLDDDDDDDNDADRVDGAVAEASKK